MTSVTAGVIWMAIAMASVLAANFTVWRAKERRWARAAAWGVAGAAGFSVLFHAIPYVWAFTCTP